LQWGASGRQGDPGEGRGTGDVGAGGASPWWVIFMVGRPWLDTGPGRTVSTTLTLWAQGKNNGIEITGRLVSFPSWKGHRHLSHHRYLLEFLYGTSLLPLGSPNHKSLSWDCEPDTLACKAHRQKGSWCSPRSKAQDLGGSL
jgi:hypothetical protein